MELKKYALICMRIAAKYEGEQCHNAIGVTSIMSILDMLNYQYDI